MIQLLRTKIHRATVTDADVNYEGSISIDPDLLDSSDLLNYESVHVWNITNGNRLQTYVIEGERGSRKIQLNGGAALLNKPGDLVIIAAFINLEMPPVDWEPRVLILDEGNNIKQFKIGSHPATLLGMRKHKRLITENK